MSVQKFTLKSTEAVKQVRDRGVSAAQGRGTSMYTRTCCAIGEEVCRGAGRCLPRARKPKHLAIGRAAHQQVKIAMASRLSFGFGRSLA